MICPYSKEKIHCLKFGPYTVPPGPCCKCTIPNPIKAKYFHIPELDDGERYMGAVDRQTELIRRQIKEGLSYAEQADE